MAAKAEKRKHDEAGAQLQMPQAHDEAPFALPKLIPLGWQGDGA
jgi:hypothetical protein